MPRRHRPVPTTDRDAISKALARAVKEEKRYDRRVKIAVKTRARWSKRRRELALRLSFLPAPPIVAPLPPVPRVKRRVAKRRITLPAPGDV